jgi:hypothetical protein
VEASASSIRAAPAIDTVTFEAEISSVLFDVAPVVSVSTVLDVRFDPTAIERIFDPSLSLTLRLDAFATTETLDRLAFDIEPPVMLTLFEF